MDDIYRILEAIEYPGKKVLATVIRVVGSAYKKEGSSMLFFEDGRKIGMISAGCLEADLAIHVEGVMRKEQAITLSYDMREETDLVWGQGTGCNGMIDIFLEPVLEKLSMDLIKVKNILDSNRPVLALKKLEAAVEYLFIPKDGKPFGKWKGDIHGGNDEVKSGLIPGLPIFLQRYQPRPRLIVFGAGSDARPLVSIAADTGFSVIVCDWREEFCKKENFTMADRLIVGFPKEILNQVQLISNDFVVIMTHHFHHDQEILFSVLQEEVRYLGVLGPRERTKRLLSGAKIPDWIYSPVGMTIGAIGPKEIAVSIMAEMIQVLRNPGKRVMANVWTNPE